MREHDLKRTDGAAQQPAFLQQGAAADRRAARLGRFHQPYRDLIACLTAAAPQAEDVAETFPALLVALVSGYGTPRARRVAYEIIVDGGQLKAAAQALGVPLWLRRLPPEAFAAPLPHLPDTTSFSVRIANTVPTAVEGARTWLDDVGLAAQIADEGYALWVAKQAHEMPAARRGPLFLNLAAWYWYGAHAETVGHRLIERGWSGKMGLRRASEEMTRWRRRAELACLIGDGIESAWLTPGSAHGYEFVALTTLNDFLTESRIMHNCLDQYADRLATGATRVFSVRRKSKPVADLEVGPIIPETKRPVIVQLKAPRNRRAPAAVWAAAEAWCRAQPVAEMACRPGPVRPDPLVERQHAFWRPFLDVLPVGWRDAFAAGVISEGDVVAAAARSPRGRPPHAVVTRIGHRRAIV